MIEELENQITRLKTHIESEKRVHDAWARYKDCPIKTAVLHQTIGMIRGLEVGKEALEYIKSQSEQENQIELPFFQQKTEYRCKNCGNIYACILKSCPECAAFNDEWIENE